MNNLPADHGMALLLPLIQRVRALEARLDGALDGAGLTPARWTVLDELMRAGEPLTLGELAARVSCVRSNMTQLVGRLDADGLVERIHDPADRRIVRAVLTEAGVAAHAAGARQLEQLQRDVGSALCAEDRAALERVVNALGGFTAARPWCGGIADV